MTELPIFMSYRQDDAMELAGWLYDSLRGRPMFALQGSLEIPKTISVYWDQSNPRVNDWHEHLQTELKHASVLLVICSPGAAKEFPANDDLYFEIRWWITNRGRNSPILITPSAQRWIPEPIRERWPYAQTINLVLRNPITQTVTDQFTLSRGVERIMEGIRLRVRGLHVENGSLALPEESQSDAQWTNPLGLYAWEKDKNFRYIRCNENYARAAGFDSPHAMIGKTDDDMPWRSLADFFREGDQKVMNAESPAREHVQEKEIMVDRVADILVTENQLLTRNKACVGVTGYFLDITGKQLLPVAQKNGDGEFRLVRAVL